MVKNNNTAVIAIVAAAVALGASFLLDNLAEKAVAGIQTRQLADAVAAFNKFYWLIYAAFIAATIAAILKSKAKEGKAKSVLAMAASIATAGAVTHLLKPIIHRLRPDGLLFVTPLFGTIDYSFPSGHATAAAAGAFSAPPAFRMAWLAFTAATIFARVYSNVHFLSDTVAGILVAMLVASLVRRLKAKIMREDWMEIRRQALHALIGLAIAAFVWKYPQLWYVILVLAAFGLALSYLIKSSAAMKNEVIRQLRKLAVAALKLVERTEELQRFPGKGAIMLFIGAGITAAVFKNEAAAAIAILAAGDSASHLAGKFFGRTNHRWIFAREKTVEGTVAGFIAAAAAASFIIPAWTAVIAAAAGMIVEAINLRILGRKIDDNLTVPAAAAAVMWALRMA